MNPVDITLLECMGIFIKAIPHLFPHSKKAVRFLGLSEPLQDRHHHTNTFNLPGGNAPGRDRRDRPEPLARGLGDEERQGGAAPTVPACACC